MIHPHNIYNISILGGGYRIFAATQGEVEASDAALSGGVCGLLWPAYASCFFTQTKHRPDTEGLPVIWKISKSRLRDKYFNHNNY